MLMRLLLSCFIVFFFGGDVAAKDLPIKYIGIEHGLSNNAVTSIYQDEYGFMWFGTYDGLNRYDGYEFKIFRNSIGNYNSVNSNNINCLEGDWYHNIWIGSQKGLVIYDQRTSSFGPVSYVPFGKKAPIKITDNVVKIKHVQKRYMFVATQYAGLVVFDGDVRNSFHVPYPGSSPHTKYHVSAVEYPGKGDSVYIFIENEGLHVYSITKRTLRLLNNTIRHGRSMKSDADGELLIGNDIGLFRYSFESKSYSDNLLRVQSSVRDITLDTDNTLWIASDGTGVWTLAHNAAYASPYLSSSGDALVNSNAVYSIYNDVQGRKWIGTLRGGLNVIEPQGNPFYHITYNRSGLPDKLVEDFILSFCEDEKGNLWIGTDGAGLRYFDRKQNDYIEYKKAVHDPTSLNSNFITHLEKDFKHDIWISTWFGGVSRFDKNKGTFRKYTLFNPNIQSVENNCWIVFEDNQQNLWVTTEGGIYRYNRTEDRFEYFDRALSSLQAMNVDRAGDLWVGNFNSIVKVDRLAKRHVYYHIGYSVRSIHEDKKRNMWVGTQDGGLLLMDRQKGTYKRFTVNEGLPNNTVLRILEDKHGNLWLSTYKGLSKFNPRDSTFHNFSQSDGLQSNQFSYNAALQLGTGEFLFGGIRGFNLFHPDSITSKSICPDIFVTGFKINNVPVENSSLACANWIPGKMNKVTIPFDSAAVSIDYVALDFSGNDKLNYAYLLDGWDQGWNYVNRSRSANYSRLHEGNYTFRVKVRTSDGNWTEDTKLLQLTILPPWYRSSWAYLVYSLLILLSLYAYVRYTRWHARLKYEVKLAHIENEKEKELAERKLSFFTNISHEFRTPLTLIIDPLQDFLRNVKGQVPQKSLEIAYRNARRLLSLVDQLMLFRKADSGHDVVNSSLINVTELCREVFSCFLQTASARQIDFVFDAPQNPVEIYGDYEKLEIVYFNLLSNAFKFTPDKGAITLEIKNIDNGVQVSVSDSGIGISPEQLGRIYEKYNRGSSPSAFSSSGFGIGLYLVKYFVELHEGTIECKSELNKGTRFVTVLKAKSPAINADQPVHEPTRNNELLKEMFIQVDRVVEESDLRVVSCQTVNELVTDKKSILVIDDNDEITDYLELIFTGSYLLYRANNGNDGYDIVRRHQPDLVISDVHMSGMDGLELCKRIKESAELAHIPVILLTGSSAEDTHLSGIEGGADDYITKPFSSELLLARIENILKNRNLVQNFFFDQVTLKPNRTKVPAEYRLFVERSIAVIEENLDKEDFCVTTFARKMGMSHSALYQKIKQVSGQTVNNFIRSIRLRQAAVLMLREDMQVKEAAFQVGLSDVKYFREQFTKLFKMTPSQYIKKYRHSFNHTLNVVKE